MQKISQQDESDPEGRQCMQWRLSWDHSKSQDKSFKKSGKLLPLLEWSVSFVSCNVSPGVCFKFIGVYLDILCRDSTIPKSSSCKGALLLVSFGNSLVPFSLLLTTFALYCSTGFSGVWGSFSGASSAIGFGASVTFSFSFVLFLRPKALNMMSQYLFLRSKTGPQQKSG